MIPVARVLCPIDFSEFSHRAFDHAAAVARRCGARLAVLHVFLNRPAMDTPPLVLDEGERQRLLAEMQRFTAHAAGRVPMDLLVTESPAVHREILCQVARLPADLLVLGSHGRSGFERLLLGSVTERVLRQAPCPVMVVPRRAADAGVDAPVHFGRVLCPIDFSPASVRSLGYARSMAAEEDGHVTLLHVIEIPPELQAPPSIEGIDVPAIRAAAEADALRRLRELVPEEVRRQGRVETSVREGAAYREILKAAVETRADLIVMGMQGRGAIDLLVFGSNTARVTRGAACPVLGVRAA